MFKAYTEAGEVEFSVQGSWSHDNQSVHWFFREKKKKVESNYVGKYFLYGF